MLRSSHQGLSHAIKLETDAGEDGVDIQTLTDEDLNTLARFNGWSSTTVGSARQSPSTTLERLGHSEWLEARPYAERLLLNHSMLTSYYTPPAVVQAIWDTVRQAGYTEGQVLEPSVGSGLFIGLSGDDGTNFKFHGVDIDPLSTRIASMLYPQARIMNKRFEHFSAGDDTYDLVLSNVPFDNTTVNDPEYSRDHARLMIHDYFFLKALDKVKPGGLVAMVTSYGTMDKADPEIRKAIAKKANLVTAARLPSGTFIGTDVGADVLVLQKLTPDMEPDLDADWLSLIVKDMNSWDGQLREMAINRYFDINPDKVLGDMSIATTQYGTALRVRASSEEDRNDLLATLSDKLTSDVPVDLARNAMRRAISHSEVDAIPSREEDAAFVPASFRIRHEHVSRLPVGSYVLNDDGQVCFLDIEDTDENSQGDGKRTAVLAELSDRKASRIAAYIPVRDAALSVLSIQTNDGSDSELGRAQKQMNDAYDAFVARFRPLNHPRNASALEDEPYSGLLYSLENYDSESETATKAPIFTERTVSRPVVPDQADNFEDALMLSLNAYGEPNLDYIRRLVGDQTITDLDIIDELDGRIYLNPRSDRYEVASTYLSGNIAVKLEQATERAAIDSDIQRNVEALQATMPAPLEPGDIFVGMGSNWIPRQYYEQFISLAMGCRIDEDDLNGISPVQVLYDDTSGVFSFEERHNFGMESDYSKRSDWETERANYKKIIEAALNNRTMNFTYEDSDGKKHTDTEATMAANRLVSQFRDNFSQWATAHPDRAAHIAEIYNSVINVWVEPKYDGSHLTFPGMSPTEKLRSNQSDFAWRSLQSGNTLAAHVVGGGKTAALIAAAMEAKRLGYANKPLFVVPKPVLYQFAASVNRFYPSANVLIITNNDLHAKNRKRFMARVATHPWDAVLVTQDAFSRIPMTPEYQKDYINRTLAEYENALDNIDGGGGERAVRRQIDSMRKRLEKLENRPKDDGTVFFEELGIDMLLVDEAHNYKNLAVSTTMAEVPGISTTESQRASDMKMKCDYIVDRNGEERGIIFATGTPITNSMVEMFNMSRYLSPTSLKQMGLSHFDAWANQFGRVVSALERKPDGDGYRVHGRFSKFVNVPELVRLFRHVADVKMAADLNLPRPEMDTEIIAIEPSTMLTGYMRSLAFRASRTTEHRLSDNILAISSDGRHASLDLRTLSEDMVPQPDDKSSAVAAQVMKRYDPEDPNKAVQLVFCDLSVPNKDRWSIYEDVRSALIKEGMPEKQIAFIHDAKTDKQREALFEDVRHGRVRVFMGSTSKMGTGVDVQNRISAMHHIDPPWRSSDIEQRDGRGQRQGNMFERIDKLIYVKKNSYDEFMHNAIKRKADFIAQALTNPDKAQRTIEEQADPTYAEVMAISSGNPLIKEKVDLEAEIADLELGKRAHLNRAHRAKNDLRSRETVIEHETPRLARLDADLAARVASGIAEPASFEFHVPEPIDDSDNCVVTDPEDFGRYVITLAGRLDYREREKVTLGKYAGETFALRSAVNINGGSHVELVRHGEQPTFSELSENPRGVAAKIRNLYRDLPDVRDRFADNIERAREEAESIKANQLGAFEGAERLNTAADRLSHVNGALQAEAEEQRHNQSWPEELMEPLALMMNMEDKRGRPLVPPEMFTDAEQAHYNSMIAAIRAQWMGGDPSILGDEFAAIAAAEAAEDLANDRPRDDDESVVAYQEQDPAPPAANGGGMTLG